MNENLILLLAGVAAVLILGKKTATTGNANTPWVPPQAIPVATPNGWQYFTNGTAISPDGIYYFQGEQVWAP